MNNEKFIKWIILINNNDLVEGIAVINNGFNAELHQHKEEEEYIFLYGIGILYNDGNVNVIKSPATVLIKSNNIHGMTPISDYVVLLFRFRKGPFENIKYNYINKYLYNNIILKSKL